MNVNDHITDSSPLLQPLVDCTLDDEAVIQFLEVSAHYLNDAVGQSLEPAPCRK